MTTAMSGTVRLITEAFAIDLRKGKTMDKNEIIVRLERLARCATHTVGERPFIMSLDDGIAVHEAIDIIQRSQRTGHWIDEGAYADYTNVHAWRCSECEDHVLNYKCDLSRYCPNCGAKMEEEDEQ